MPAHTLHIIGIDGQLLNSSMQIVVANCDTLVLSDRFREQLDTLVPNHSHLQLVSMTPVGQSVETIERRLQIGDVAVFATGDPLFFGIGKRLVDSFSNCKIQIYPAVSSMQYAFAKFKIPWDDARFLSLHGRTEATLITSVARYNKTGLLTDGNNTPAVIARKLMEFFDSGEGDHFTVHIAENLGLANEKLTTGTLDEVSQRIFDSLCCMILVKNKTTTSVAARFGLQETEIIHSRGLITKNEVRAAAIHALRLEPGAVLWDVGAGSGSVGLEAARVYRDLLVYSVEKNNEQLLNIAENKKKFDVLNLRLVSGEAPEAFAGLPQPSRIFIGGSGGRLATVINACVSVLAPGGIMVITGVLEKTCREAPEALYGLGLQVETRKIEVTRKRYPHEDEIVLNPITIIVGTKNN